MLPIRRLAEEVYEVDAPISHLGASEIQFLKDHVYKTQRKRIRICMHKNAEEKLHEMFVCYVKETYVRPNKHNRDESLHIIHGSADFIFFDNRGEITDVAPLGDYESGRNFYCRVPEAVYHTLIIRSDIIVIHESIAGPFRRENTAFAPWGPEESDLPAVSQYMNQLAQRIEPICCAPTRGFQ